MKKFIQWLANVFNANITVEVVKTVEKVVTKEVPVEVIKEVIKEIPVEVIKEVPVEKVVTKEVIKEVEKPIYVVSSTIPSDTKLIENDVVIDGNLEVKGNLYVSGGVTCLSDIKIKKAINNVKKKGEKNELY